jgi:hypothetical protein
MHEPKRLIESADGSKANRAGVQKRQNSGRGEESPSEARLPFPRQRLSGIGATRPGFPAASSLPSVAMLGLDWPRLRCGADLR